MDARVVSFVEPGGAIDRMRNGWRKILSILGLGLICLLAEGPAPAARLDGSSLLGSERPVRLTIEIAWSSPVDGASEPREITLEVPEGEVVEAIAWPRGMGAGTGFPSVTAPARRPEGGWRLGAERSGRVRARVEAPVGASLVLRVAGEPMRFPLAYILEGPQKSPAQSPVEIAIERVPWDVISVNLGSGKNGQATETGIVAPGAKVPVTVGFHVLSPESTEVSMRCTAELKPVRGGDPVWQGAIQQVISTNNSSNPPTFTLPVEMPQAEGTYILELHAAWEPAPAHDSGKFIGRLIRRGKRGLFGGSATATRRVSLAVLGNKETRPPGVATTARDQEVDTIDLARSRGHRLAASGRSPLAAPGRDAWPLPDEALAESTRRDRLRGWITRASNDVGQLGSADATGLAWSAVGLKVSHPGRPHRLALTVTGGHPSALGVAMVGPGPRPRLLLDARASGAPVLPDGPAGSFSWLVWPDTAEPVLVMVNRDSGSPVRIGSITLTELAELPPGPAVDEPQDVPTRKLGLYLTGSELLDRFGGGGDSSILDMVAVVANATSYLHHCGATGVVLPDSLADRAARRALDGQASEDSMGPDRLDLAIELLHRHGIATWLELAFDGPLNGLPAPSSPEAIGRGLARVDRNGQADGAAPVYNPLHKEVAEAMRRKVAETLAAHKAAGALAGVVVRLGPGSTLLGSPDSGFDDGTFDVFVRETFDPVTARNLPGQGSDDPGRFTARSQFLAGSGRMPWLAWRSRKIAALYASLAETVRSRSPGATLAVATPGPDEGAAGVEARRADLAGLAPSLAWRAVGLDLDVWPTGEAAPIILRGIGMGADGLARDLATSPELDAKVAARPARGLLLGIASPLRENPPRTRPGLPAPLALRAPSIDDGDGGDEPLEHALASLDARWVWLAGPAVAGQEESLRRFARVYRALPATPPVDKQLLAFGVAVRSYLAGGKSYLMLANDTPYPIRLESVLAGNSAAEIYDLGRGALLKPTADASGRHLVLDLLPFGVASTRIDATDAKVSSVTPYPSETVLTSMQAQYEVLSTRLTKLTHRDKARSVPPNPGFEPEGAGASRTVPLRMAGGTGNDPMAVVETKTIVPAGWQLAGSKGPENGLAIDLAQHHGGRGALRIDGPEPPIAAVCDEFTPNLRTYLQVGAWLRSERPDAKVRVWIEGEAAGKPYRRVSELVVQPTWAERAVRAGDIPAGGLDVVKLRFELLTTGRLWIDDLTVTGEALSEPERRNSRNALLAAIQAYREKRFADFARLAGSHWARHVDTDPEEDAPDRVAAERSGLNRSSDASALPQGRRLR